MSEEHRIWPNEKIALSIAETAESLGVSRRLIELELARGRLGSTRVAGRRLILREDLSAYLDRRRVRAQ